MKFVMTLLALTAVAAFVVRAPAARSVDTSLTALTLKYKRPAGIVAARDGLQDDAAWTLGERLFFDPRLSASQGLSCAGCHKPDQSWSDHRAKAQGEGPEPLAFRTPTLLDAGLLDRYGWTGRFPDVEAVSFFAMVSTANMNLKTEDLLDRLKADPDYVKVFRETFADGAISKHNIGTALGRFVGSIVSEGAPFDRWAAGDAAAIGHDAKRGFALFNGKAHCSQCHSGWAFTDGSFHDIGTATGDDIGRGRLFKTSNKLQYAFKTPTLRNVAERAPYTHDGHIASLADMIDLYDKGGIDRPSRAEAIMPLHLTDQEKSDLLAFLKTLSGHSTFARIEP